MGWTQLRELGQSKAGWGRRGSIVYPTPGWRLAGSLVLRVRVLSQAPNPVNSSLTVTTGLPKLKNFVRRQPERAPEPGRVCGCLGTGQEGQQWPPEGTAVRGAGLSRGEGARRARRPRAREWRAGGSFPGPRPRLGSPVRGEGREGSWTRRRFMGLSGEQVPPRAAHCLAGLTMGLPQPQGRPPPRPEACPGARAPGRRGPPLRRALVGASVRAPSGGEPAQRARASGPAHDPRAPPECTPRPDVRPRPRRPLLTRRRAPGSARLAQPRAAASRTHTQGPILPGSVQPYGKSASTQHPPLIQAQNVPQRGTIRTLFASIMDADGREKKSFNSKR